MQVYEGMSREAAAEKGWPKVSEKNVDPDFPIEGDGGPDDDGADQPGGSPVRPGPTG